MKNKIPKISVVMSVYNGEKYLREAIDSILNQTFADFEFIIIDDGSTDESSDIIKSYNDPRIILIRQKNKGLAAALNVGIKAARGKYIARMDADDISAQSRLEKQILFMESNPVCVALGTNAVVINEDGEELYKTDLPLDNETIKSLVVTGCPFYHGSVMLKRDTLFAVDGYNEEVRMAQDDFLWIKIQNHGYFYLVKEALYYYRITSNNISKLNKTASRKLREIIIDYAETDALTSESIAYINNIATSKHTKLKKAMYCLQVGRAKLVHGRDRKGSRGWLLKAIRIDPFNSRAIFNLLLSYLPYTIIEKWKIYREAKS